MQQRPRLTAALCAGVRRARLLSVTGLPVSLRPRPAQLRLPPGQQGMANALPVSVAVTLCAADECV